MPFVFLLHSSSSNFMLKIRCSNARGILDVCATCCRKANHPDPVQNVQVFTNYGTFLLNGFDEVGLGEILRNINVPLSRFVDCSMFYKRLYLDSPAIDSAQPSIAVWVRIQSRMVGVPIDTQCTPEILKMRLTAKTTFKDVDKLYRMYLNGNPLQVGFVILSLYFELTSNMQDGVPLSQQASIFGSVSLCADSFSGMRLRQHYRSGALSKRSSALLCARERKCHLFAYDPAHSVSLCHQKLNCFIYRGIPRPTSPHCQGATP